MTVVGANMQPGPLRPNANDMYDFMSWWFKDCNRGLIELGWLDPATKILNRFERFDLTEIEECAAFAADKNAQAGANVYFRASTISETAGTFTTDADFRQAPGPWADHDSIESIRRLEANSLSVKPCGWTVTGWTPHVRAQTFWALTEPLTDPDMVRDLNSRLAAAFAGDPAVVNPTRLMRLPGSIAWPVKQGRTIAELTAFCEPKDDRPRRHVLHNIAFALPKPATPAAPTPTTAPAGQAGTILPGLNTARGLMDRMKAGDNWHNNMVRLVAHWIGRGWSNAEILAAVEPLTLPGYTVAQTHAEVAKAIEGGRRKWGAPDPEHDIGTDDPSAPKPPALWIDAAEWAEEAIPARPWLAPGYLMRGAVSALSGQGSGGKSSLVVCWTIALATGKAVGEFRPAKPCKVVNYNVEDDELEQRRRYSAALRASGRKPADVAGQVIRCGPESIGTLFERHPDTGRIVPTAAMEALEALCKESGADVLVCDPLAELHNAEENDNTAMRAVIAAFRGLAKRLNIAVLLLHHDRKGNNTPGDMDRLRGASAITGAVRVLLTLTSMSPEEAERFGIPPEERRRHFRIDGAKSNYAIAQEAEWWRLAGYPLANGEEVAACLPWAPPSPFASLSMADCVAALDTMHAGTTTGHAWAAMKQAGADWGGRILTEGYGLTDAQAGAVLGAWMDSRIINVEMRPSPRERHQRKAFVVNLGAVSEMRRHKSGGISE